jgi:hypothetical protein
MSLRGSSALGSTCYCVATLAENFRPIIDGHINPTRFRLFKAFVGGRLCWTKKSYAALRGFIASLVRSRLACRPRSIAPTLCGWMSAPTSCSNGSTTAAFSPRARAGACEIASARKCSARDPSPAGSPQPRARRPEGPPLSLPPLKSSFKRTMAVVMKSGSSRGAGCKQPPFISLVTSSSAADRKWGRTTLVMVTGSSFGAMQSNQKHLGQGVRFMCNRGRPVLSASP